MRITDRQLHLLEEVFNGYRHVDDIYEMIEIPRAQIRRSLDRMQLNGLVEFNGTRADITPLGIVAMNERHEREARRVED